MLLEDVVVRLKLPRSGGIYREGKSGVASKTRQPNLFLQIKQTQAEAKNLEKRWIEILSCEVNPVNRYY